MYLVIENNRIKELFETNEDVLKKYNFNINDNGQISFNGVIDTISYGTSFTKEEIKKDFIRYGRVKNLASQSGLSIFKLIETLK